MKARRVQLLALAAAIGVAQQADYRVPARFEKKLGIEELFARVDARNDEWVGERDYEAIHQQLEEAAARFKKNEPAFPRLDELAQRFRRIDVAQLKVVGSNRASPDARRAAIRLRVELAGESREGGRLSLQGHWETSWDRDGEQWKLASVAPAALREVRGGAIQFLEMTGQALGGNESFHKQLSRGADHWRGILDEATGIDVYGHNGIAVGDYDGDGWEDLYVCQPSGLPNRLFHNNGNGTFSDVTAAAGLDVLDDTRAALFADWDRDGDQDLLLITAARPLLFRNNGKGRFAPDSNANLNIPKEEAGSLTSAAAADYDRDGWLDLYVCSYDFWSPGRSYNAPTPYYDARNGPPNFLFRNREGKGFENVTRRAGLMENNDRYSFAAAWSDYDGDGWPDLYVANDFGRNNLYRNKGDGTFRDVAAEAGVEDSGAGMSAAWGDYDGDGRPDLYVGNMWSSAGQRVTGNTQFRQVARDGKVLGEFQRQARGNTLLRNLGGSFQDSSGPAGVEMGRWAWSSDFADLDNDGMLDLYVANGYITGPDTHDL